MNKAQIQEKRLRGELAGAALRYCAVADWFESAKGRKAGNLAFDQFKQAEAQLREAGAKALRKHGHRFLVLQAAGIPEALR